jgi:hypothetical protein
MMESLATLVVTAAKDERVMCKLKLICDPVGGSDGGSGRGGEGGHISVENFADLAGQGS